VFCISLADVLDFETIINFLYLIEVFILSILYFQIKETFIKKNFNLF